jgi:hypothetical protein
MIKPQEEKNVNFESEKTSNNNESLKIWETPKLKVLPVPNRTQGGNYLSPSLENTYYRTS